MSVSFLARLAPPLRAPPNLGVHASSDPGGHQPLATGCWLPATGYCLAAYLYGSLPFVYLLGLRWRVDLKRVGSGNVGGSNLWAAGGMVPGLMGWLFDASKGLLPVAVCRRLGGPEELARLAGVCGVAGQCWPIFLRFNGGRGISAFIGASFAIDRAAWRLTLLPFIAGGLWRVGPVLARRLCGAGARLRATRSKAMPLGCFVGAVTFPVACIMHIRSVRSFSWVPTLLTLVIVLRRLTAPLPDDATHGPAIHARALLFRLLYDRNTSE